MGVDKAGAKLNSGDECRRSGTADLSSIRSRVSLTINHEVARSTEMAVMIEL